MRRTLILDDDDLVMVVKQDVVKQIDEKRGELTRTEFVNYLIQCQLRQMQENTSYVTKQEFQDYTCKMAELVKDFMDCVISAQLGPNTGEHPEIKMLNRQIEELLGHAD